MNIVFDIGGTNMRVAAAEGEVLGEVRKVPTPKDAREGVALFIDTARAILGDRKIEAAAGCFAGKIDANGELHGARNLRGWHGTNIVKEFSDGLGTPVRLLNDAILAGYGEAHAGAGIRFSRIAYITVSTGVGGALIQEDLPNSPQLADVQLKIGDLEDQISGTAVSEKFGIHPRELDSIDERNKLADILAAGLAELADVWKPDVFVIGGSMIIGINPIPLERVREKFDAVPVIMAELGDNGGLIGGAILAMQQ
jgi:glucokinase